MVQIIETVAPVNVWTVVAGVVAPTPKTPKPSAQSRFRSTGDWAANEPSEYRDEMFSNPWWLK